MNYFGSCAKGFRFDEQFMDVDDMNDSMSWAQGSRCYEQLKVVDDMNMPLDAMNDLGLLKIWTILGHEH